MPKYVYKCNECEEHFEVYHGMSENQEGCVYCRALSPHRVPQMPFLKRSIEPKGGKVGDKVKEAIEANKGLLREAKQKAEKEFYDDS
jgi:DNA-directed RNA polymerase subunit RPC12/RpoP